MELLVVYLVWFKYIFLLMCLYLTGAALGNLRAGRKVPVSHPKTRFAVLIPAHNEETVIGDLLASLNEANYPKELLDIYVIADNCTDETAAVSAKAGARVLHRTHNNQGGKGRALFWGMERIPETYDALVVFDADNLAAPEYFSVMNNYITAGYPALQAHLDVKNPHDTLITKILYVQQEVTNILWHRGRDRLGIGVYLIGTGMCISKEALNRVPWRTGTLTEDLEYSILLAMSGMKVTWVDETKVFDEKPPTLWASWRQQQRWTIGIWNCFIRYLRPLLTAQFRAPSLVLLGLISYLCTPALILSNAVYAFANMINSAFHLAALPPNPVMTALGCSFGITYLTTGMVLSRVSLVRNLPYMVMYLAIFPASAMVQSAIGLLLVRERRWYHTPHYSRLDPEKQHRSLYQ